MQLRDIGVQLLESDMLTPARLSAAAGHDFHALNDLAGSLDAMLSLQRDGHHHYDYSDIRHAEMLLPVARQAMAHALDRQ